MRNAASRVCKAPFSDPKARNKGCFWDAGAERMRTRWEVKGKKEEVKMSN
ncbi:MAG: hypothetical protein LBK66_08370 [Spirochaetaceae bacterium]|jgi:hypothetical protein|nr:hypothetical protein [Spirochaetaceae bacterium]